MTCEKCQKRKALPGRSRCRPCRVQDVAHGRAVRARRRRLKLCMSCGASRRKAGRSYCAACLKYYADRNRAFRARQPKPPKKPRPLHPTYKKILIVLKSGPRTGQVIGQALRTKHSGIYVQLRRMADHGLIVQQRDARWAAR